MAISVTGTRQLVLSSHARSKRRSIPGVRGLPLGGAIGTEQRSSPIYRFLYHPKTDRSCDNVDSRPVV